MKTLLVYASKSGAAKACAEIIAAQIPCTIVDVSANPADPSGYDAVIIGSGVRIGKIYKGVRKFIKENMAALLTMKTAIYLCNGEPSSFAASVEKNIPQELRQSARTIQCLGGKPPFRSAAEESTWLQRDSLQALIDQMK